MAVSRLALTGHDFSHSTRLRSSPGVALAALKGRIDVPKTAEIGGAPASA